MSQATLARARAGDATAFGDLTGPYRRELQVHCYRILGSLADAEDMLQETLLAAWRGLDAFEGRSSVRSWLYRIATNRCLNALRAAGRRAPSAPQPPFEPPEPTRRGDIPWLQPYPDALLDQAPGPDARYQARESVELAFIAGLQRLPPRQAAALILRDVLGFTTAEVAGMLDTNETAVKGLLQRARARPGAGRPTAGRSTADGPAADGPADRPAPDRPEAGSARERDLIRRFADAFTADDVDAVVALLTDDAWLRMPPAPHEYQGRAAIAAFLGASARFRAGRRFRLVPTRANTQPAFGCYLPDRDGPVPRPAGLVVLTPHGERIAVVTRFLDDGLFARFGLPPTLTA